MRRDLTVLAAGLAVSTTGDAAALVALLLRLQPHGSGWVAALLAAELLPYILLAPVTGRVVDRFVTRAVLLVALAGQAVVCVPLAFAADRRAIVALFAAVTALSAFVRPATSALVPVITGDGPAQRGYARLATGTGLGWIAGPAVGGLLSGGFGPTTAVLADAATFAVLTLACATIRARRRPAPVSPAPAPGTATAEPASSAAAEATATATVVEAAVEADSIAADVEAAPADRILAAAPAPVATEAAPTATEPALIATEPALIATEPTPIATEAVPAVVEGAGDPGRGGALRLIFADRILRTALIGSAIAISSGVVDNVAAPFRFVGQLGAHDSGYGLYLTLWGVGALAGAQVLPRIRIRQDAALALGNLLVGAGIAGIGLAPGLALAFAASALGGLGNGIMNVSQNALISGRTPPAHHGRAFAAAGAVVQSAIGAGTAAAAPLVAALGADGAMLAAGALTCLTSAVALVLTRRR